MLEKQSFPALITGNLNFMYNRVDYDEESNAHSTHQSYTNVHVSSKNVADRTLYKFGLIHPFIFFFLTLYM